MGGTGTTGAEGARRETRALPAPPLVGRARELDLLREACGTPPALVLLEGESGVGKTRLVREFLRHADVDASRRLLGHCHPIREPFPLGPVLESLRATTGTLPPPDLLNPVTGALRPVLPELARELPAELTPLADRREDRHRTFRGLLELLSALGPAVLVIEDLHWVDRGTYEFVRFLCAQIPSTLSIVVTYRPEDLSTALPVGGIRALLPPDARRTTLALSPLDAPAVGKLIRAMLERDDVPAAFTHHVHERTHGLPLVVEEVVRGLVERRRVSPSALLAETTGTSPDMPVPSVLRESMLARLEPLGDDARSAANAAAVLAVPAPEGLIVEVAGLSPARGRRALAEGLSAAILRELGGGLYGFRHALATQAIYDAIPGPDRAHLHRAAARAVTNGPQPLPLAQLARHHKESGCAAQWRHFAEAAADQALAMGEDAAAADLLSQVLEDPELDSDHRVQMAIKLGRASVSGLAPDQAIATLRRILEHEPLHGSTRGELKFQLGLLLVNHLGDATGGRETLKGAVEDLHDRPALAARAMAILAGPEWSSEANAGDQLARLDRAVETARRATDPLVELEVLAIRSWLGFWTGEPAAEALVDRVPAAAGDLERDRRVGRICTNLAYATAWAGHYDLSRMLAKRGRLLAERGTDSHMSNANDSNALLVDWWCGIWSGLDTRVAKLAEVGPAVRPMVTEGQLLRALLGVAQGDLERGLQALLALHEGASREGPLPLLVTSASGAARVLLARGEIERANALLATAVSPLRRRGFWALAGDVAPVAVAGLIAAEEPTGARDLADEMSRALAGRKAPAASAALAECRALVAEADGDGDRARASYALAEERWLALTRPYDGARCRAARGSSLLASADESGRSLVFEALDVFESLGARWDASRTRSVLRRHGVEPTRRPRRIGYGDDLSPREREVATLASAGQTNRQIAAALYISPRTVEEHVANALRKLGLRSRGELRGIERDRTYPEASARGGAAATDRGAGLSGAPFR